MIRGFLSGVFWGGVAGILALGAASQFAPLPVARIAADATAVQVPKPAPVDPAAKAGAGAPAEGLLAEPAPLDPVVAPQDAAPVAEPAAVAPATAAPAPAPAEVPLADPATEVGAKPAAATTAELDPPPGSEFAKPLPDVEPVLPAADAARAPDAAGAQPLIPPTPDAASLTDTPASTPEAGSDAPKPLNAPKDSASEPAPEIGAPEQFALAQPGQPILPQTDTAPPPEQNPVPPPKAEPEEALLKPLPDTQPLPEAPVEPSVELVPDPPVLRPEGDGAATLVPTPGLDGTVDGVTIGRLPRIDAEPLPQGQPVPATEAAPEAGPALVIDGEAEVPPLQKYARSFENPDAKPVFAIILIDTGEPGLDRAALAALPFPVSFVLDPLAPNVAGISKIYRDAGQEVVMVATGIPEGATASDLEVTFQAHAAALPQAVAVIDTEFGAFQANRPLATQVVPILKAQGRGLISWDRGLNAADQVARREGLAAGMVFRKLDGAGENKAAVRRALDRAAFKAAQDGRVMVIGQTVPETVAALLEWAVEGRAASVALAPVSAVLSTQQE